MGGACTTPQEVEYEVVLHTYNACTGPAQAFLGLLGGGGKTILRLAVALFFVLEYRIPQRALLALRGGGAPRAALPAGVRIAPLRLRAKF